MLYLQLAFKFTYFTIDNNSFIRFFGVLAWPFSIPWICLLLCYNFIHFSHLCFINIRSPTVFLCAMNSVSFMPFYF